MVRKTLSYLKIPVSFFLTTLLIFFLILNQGIFDFSPFAFLTNSVVQSSAEGNQPGPNPAEQKQSQQQSQSKQQPPQQQPPSEQAPQQQQTVDPSDQTIIGLKINDPFMTINGAKIEIDPGRGTSPRKPKDRVLIPLTSLVNILGGTVKYEPIRKHIFVTLNETNIELIVNVKLILVNGTLKRIDYAPEIINGRTMVPVRFVAENCNINVQWKNPEVILTANYLPTGMRKAKDLFNNVITIDNYSKLPKIFEIFSRIY